MKKVFSFALAAAVACALFAGCTTGGPAPSKNNNVEAEGALKTGLGVITSTKATAAADGAEGSFAPTFTAAAVVVCAIVAVAVAAIIIANHYLL